MQRAIEIHPAENYEPLEVEVTEPGVLRRILTGMRQPSSIIPASMGKAPVAELIPHPALMFEVNPELKTRKRMFIWLPVATKLTYPGKLEYRETYIDEGTGAPLILYEVIKTNGS